MAFPTKVYCATQALGVYYTDSFVGPETGQQPTWAAVNGGLPNTLCRQFALDPHAAETRQFVLLTDGSLHMRESGGNWTEILNATDAQTTLALGTGQPTAFCCDTLNPGTLYVSHTGGLLDIDPHYLKSTDYGTTWTGGVSYVSNIGKTRIAGLIRAHGDRVYIGWNGRTVVQGLVFYSANGGTTWSYSGFAVAAGYTPLRDINPLTPGYAYAVQNLPGGDNYDMYTVPPKTLLREDRYPSTASAMRFHPTDAGRQLLLCGGVLCKTYDGWATIDAESPSSLGTDLIAICPQWWADDDVIIGHAFDSDFAISAIQEISDTTPTPLAGSNYNSSPYTDSIPETHGGVCWDGIQAIISLPTEGPTPPDGETIEVPGNGSVTLVGTGGTVQAVSMPGYTDIHRGVPMPGDRAAWDETDYPDLHARDIQEETFLHHIDPDNPPPHNLYELDDVDTDGVVDGDALLYDDATATWLPADVLTPTEHTAIGDGSPHHASVTLGAGNDAALTLSGQELTLTLPESEPGAEVLMADGVTAPPVPIETEGQDDWLYEG